VYIEGAPTLPPGLFYTTYQDVDREYLQIREYRSWLWFKWTRKVVEVGIYRDMSVIFPELKREDPVLRAARRAHEQWTYV
jgi:hypothetical protein